MISRGHQWIGLPLLLALVACPPQEPHADSTGAASTTSTTWASTTGATQTTAHTTTLPTSGDSSTTTVPPECTCHSDCRDLMFCYPDGHCNIDPNDCGEALLTLPIPPSNVVLVVDKSGSMGAILWDGDGDPNTPAISRWYSLHGAISHLVSTYDRSLNFGAVLSPSKSATTTYNIAACPVEANPEVAVAPMNAAVLLAELPPATAQAPALAGATPTRAALNTAIGHLSTQVDGLPRAIVLITDGAPNCSLEAVDETSRLEMYDAALVQTVADATAMGITTFVVGLAVEDEASPTLIDGEPDATNLYDRLNELALAGGAPQDDPDQRFFGARNQPEIESALTTIATALLPCVAQLAPPPIDVAYVDASVGGVDYGMAADVADCTGIDGWRYIDAKAGTIELCGQACADFQTTGMAEFLFRCPRPPEPPQCPPP